MRQFLAGIKSYLADRHSDQRLSSLGPPYTPSRILLTIAAAVFIAEALVMLVLSLLPPIPILLVAILDPMLLVVLISPVFYLYLFRPLTRHIVEQSSIEKRLRRNKNMLQTIFDGITDPLLLLDKELNVKMINQAAINYYGVNPDAVVDLPCYRAFKNLGVACEECRISKTVSGDNTVVFERTGPIDPSRLEQVVIYRSRTQDNAPGAVIIRISDVTEAKTMERQMIQQEKMASLGLLISSIVHEINNPNNMISLNLPILKDYFEAILPIVRSSKDVDHAIEHLKLSYDEFEKDIFELLENVEHGSERINTIVSQLRDFSRINKRKKEDWIKIGDVVRRALTICNGQLKSTAVSLDLEIPEDFPKIYTNAEYLEQVLINLLINASQALDKMDNWIRLSAFIGPNWREHVIIEVSDNGCGMTDETMKRIFEPLFTTKDSRKGTGLGLYVCHNLIENIGGRIEVESKPGHGAKFRVILTGRERRAKPRDGKRVA
ncbi:MAG: ATP-binding protein [Desulfobacteraceae bacterium]